MLSVQSKLPVKVQGPMRMKLLPQKRQDFLEVKLSHISCWTAILATMTKCTDSKYASSLDPKKRLNLE